MQKYIIGIDTGGTYTDAVLLERATGKIVQAAKTPTTHHQLSLGITQAFADLLELSGVSSEAIHSVAISSTLATNAVVESRGARVAVFVIGYVKHFKLPVTAVLFVKGGHTFTGEEEEPLDLDYLVSVIDNLRDEVDAFGVCSAMSFKNPSHELVAEKAIGMIAPKPVFCSHKVSSLAGMQERAATVGLHAKLMPLMQDFIDGVKHAMDAHSITSPLVIIGGNAEPIASQRAIEHAGMTVASGPACTTLFGAHFCETDALIIDVGGTTTDVTMIRQGQPLFSEEGCQIGEWKTHVKAINMHTRGIGGDSHVLIDKKNKLFIGPSRVTPLATSRCPADIETWLGDGAHSKCIDLIETPPHDHRQVEIIQTLLNQGPCTPAQLKNATGLSGIPMEKQLEHLSRLQLIRETGFTPTDALHVLGKIELGDTSRAVSGAAILGEKLNMSGEEFSAHVIQRTVENIENSILEFVTQLYWQKTLTAFIETRNNHAVLGVDFSLKVPLIGIGASAKYFLPQVAERLKTKVHFPENYHVGNAIGAALIMDKQR